MGNFSHQELEDAFKLYDETVRKAVETKEKIQMKHKD